MTTCLSCGAGNVVSNRFCGACGRPLGAVSPRGEERRVVTVLFCDLVGFTTASDGADPEDVQAVLTPYYTRARAVIERFGGTVEKFIGDAVMAAFGTPVTHEDDPERAVRAGLALVSAVEELNQETSLRLAIRVGVDTGVALVSTGARVERGEGMLAGDVVNTAARLQGVAPVGGVLVGRACHDATEPVVDYLEQEEVRVRGKADPLRVWLATEVRSSTGRPPAGRQTAMVGRQRELDVLTNAFLGVLADGAARRVAVAAEPGMGKSRLVEALFDWVDQRGELVTWRQARCLSYGDTAFGAFGRLIKAQAGILDSDDAETALTRLAAQVGLLTVDPGVEGDAVGDVAGWLSARLAPLVGGPPSEASREELFAAWTRLVELMAARGPVVLVVEDLHAADAALLDLLDRLVPLAKPVLLVVTSRPELFVNAPAWRRSDDLHAILELEPLGREATGRLIDRCDQWGAVPAGLRLVLAERASGNPLFARELVAMVAQGAAQTTSTSRSEELPETVRAVIAARLDSLPATSRRLLQAGAVLGQTLWAEAVAVLLGESTDVVGTGLQDLVSRDYLRPAGASRLAGQRELVFQHELVVDVAYGQLPRGVRATLHERAGEWYRDVTASGAEPDHRDARGDRTAVIAHHLTRAHDLAAAAGHDTTHVARVGGAAGHWHERAGSFTRHIDLVAGERHAREALRLMATSDPRRTPALLLLGDVLYSRGEIGAAERAFLDARDTSRARGDEVAAAVADVRRSGTLGATGRAAEAIEVVDDAVGRLERADAEAELIVGYSIAASRQMALGRHRAAIHRADQSLALAARLDPEGIRVGSALWVRGASLVALGDLRGREDLERALDLAQRQNLSSLAIGLNDELGGVASLTQSSAAALHYRRRAYAMAVQRGSASDVAFFAANLAENLAIAGLVDEALELCRGAEALSAAADSPRDVMMLHLYWAWVSMLTGDTAHADRLLAGVLPMARQVEPVVAAQALLVALECARAEAGDVDRLRRELLEVLSAGSADGAFSAVLTHLVRALIPGVDDLAPLVDLVEGNPAGMVFHEASVASARAMLAEADGRTQDAGPGYDEAARLWASYGYPFEEAHAWLGAARCARAAGVTAAASIDRARRAAKAAGSPALLEAAEAP